jgi:filamentous hemagglutinin family protein
MIHKRMIAGLMLFAYLAQPVVIPIVLANPTGPDVVGGQAAVSGLGTSHVTIDQASQHAVINWQQFNIAPNEVTQFNQPNVQSIALNRIFDQSPSQIFGSLRANGSVILLNRNGILFGPNAQVDVGGLIASSLNLTNGNFLAGHYLFQGTGLEGLVKNMGAIQGSHNGVYLLAPNVENSGVIASPGGNIVLAAGAKAFLSNRSDGRGFLAELSNPLGQAVNVKDLIADGGTITVAGRVVNQAGVIRADSVREQNGKIELLASEAVTLRDGSRTLARGDQHGVSNGGTIRAIADLKSGTATFQKGGLVDVSGGKNGGHGGFAEVSGAAVKLGGQFLGRTLAGFHGGRFLIDPTVTTSSVGPTEFASFEGSGASEVTFQSPAGSDLVVTGQYDLNAGWNLSGGTGTLTFLAGANLIFDNAQLTNTSGKTELQPDGTSKNVDSNTKWDYVGTAVTGDVRFTNSILSTGFGGNMTLTAAAPGGNINLVDAIGNLSVLRTSEAGGNITLTAGHDVLSPSAASPIMPFIDPNVLLGGIRLDGPGNLTINAGNDFRGGSTQGVLAGPGFVLTNGTANVTAGRNIGSPKPVGANATDPDEYANLTLGSGTINLTAQTGSIYLGRVQDKGVTDILIGDTITVDPSNKVVLQADQDIFLNPRKVGTFEAARTVSVTYPASLSARTTSGSIFVGEESLTFWPSTTGAVTFSAGKDLIGLQSPSQVPDVNYDYIFVGFKNVPGGHWQLVNLKEAVKDPKLAPFISTYTLDAFNGIPKPGDNNGGRTVTILTNPPSITLLQADPNLFSNQPFDGTRFTSIDIKNTAKNVPQHNVQDVVFESRSGNIKTLVLNLQSVPFHKRVTVDAAKDIDAVTAKIGVPDGVEARVHAGGNLNMRTAGTLGASAASDLTFNGTGTARVVVGGLLDLATSTGINFRFLPDPSLDVNKGGFLDLSVGGSIKMDSSLIASYNGAPISIHGPGIVPILDAGGNVGLDNGKPVAVAGQVVQVGGRSVIQVNGKTLEFKNKAVVLDGAQTLSDVVNPVSIHLSMVEQGGKLLTNNGKSYQVLRAEVPLNATKTLTGFDPVVVNGQLVLVAPDGTVLLVPASQTAKVQSLPGSVAVGSNVSFNPNTLGAPLGITTLGGGGIDVLAKGDINVEKSRISTFQGGDINLTSTNGNINAGSGSRNETVNQIIKQTTADGQEVTLTIQVPASGISTFHPEDPRPLKFIEFNDPEISALRDQASKETFFGRTESAAALLAKANALQAQRQPIFNESQLKPYINSLKLGDVNLTAETGAVVIPSAGIQGRTVQIFAPRVDNQGGQIIGNVIIPATVNVSGPPLSITGTGSGAVATPITPVSGSSATASVSATTAAVSTSAKSTDDVQEAASEGSGKRSEAKAKQVAANKNDEGDKKGLAKSIRVKRGVVIQVDVKPQQGS